MTVNAFSVADTIIAANTYPLLKGPTGGDLANYMLGLAPAGWVSHLAIAGGNTLVLHHSLPI